MNIEMRRIIFLLLGIGLFFSCQKLDDNGDFGGYWKLLQIEDFEGDSIIDKRGEDRFWAVQLDLIQIGTGKGRFQRTDDSLFIQMIYKTEKPEEYGLFHQEDASYCIEHLTNRSMGLRCNEARLLFRKF